MLTATRRVLNWIRWHWGKWIVFLWFIVCSHICYVKLASKYDSLWDILTLLCVGLIALSIKSWKHLAMMTDFIVATFFWQHFYTEKYVCILEHPIFTSLNWQSLKGGWKQDGYKLTPASCNHLTHAHIHIRLVPSLNSCTHPYNHCNCSHMIIRKRLQSRTDVKPSKRIL